jgi:hypothetical protein
MDQCVLQKKGDGLFSRRPEPNEPDELYELSEPNEPRASEDEPN